MFVLLFRYNYFSDIYEVTKNFIIKKGILKFLTNIVFVEVFLF